MHRTRQEKNISKRKQKKPRNNNSGENDKAASRDVKVIFIRFLIVCV